MNRQRLLPVGFALLAALQAGAALGAKTPVEQATSAAAAKASPELVGALSKEIGGTPEQAAGAAGALFGLAKTRLKPNDFSRMLAGD